MSKKSDYFQFRFEPDFSERINEMIRLGNAKNFSDAIRKFCYIGIEVAKISDNNPNILDKLENELQNHDKEFTDSNLKDLVHSLTMFDHKFDALKSLTQYEMYNLSLVVFNELLNRPWSREYGDLIRELDQKIANHGIEDHLRSIHFREKTELSKPKNQSFNFDALEEVSSIDSSKGK